MPDPFGAARGERLYRTGDLGRCRRDGDIEFLGPRRRPGEDPRLPHRARRGRDACSSRTPAVRESGRRRREDIAGRPAAGRLCRSYRQRPATVRPRRRSTTGERSTTRRTARARPRSTRHSTSLGGSRAIRGLRSPPDEMREWRDATVERVLAHDPRVLEVGCGTGLLLFRRRAVRPRPTSASTSRMRRSPA